MIRPIHKDNEKVLTQKATQCIPLIIGKQTVDKKAPVGLTDAIEVPETKQEDSDAPPKKPWLPHVLDLIQDLKDTAENIADECLGLASNQIWVPENYGQDAGTPPPAVFIMRWPDTTQARHWGWKAILNPAVKPTGKTLKKQEGCLSIPNKDKTTSRGKNAYMKWQAEESLEMQFTHLREMQGQFAQIAQHEFDHLRGKHI